MKNLTFIFLGCIFVLFFNVTSFAETTMSQEGQYIFNSLGFYIGGVLVAFMAAGFCMLESGLVTTKSVSTIAAKNICLLYTSPSPRDATLSRMPSSA